MNIHQQAESITPTVYTVPQAAKAEGVTKAAIRDWITTGVLVRTETGKKRIALQAKKKGGRYQIEKADLEAFIQVTTQAAVSPSALPPTETESQLRKRRAESRRRFEEALRS